MFLLESWNQFARWFPHGWHRNTLQYAWHRQVDGSFLGWSQRNTVTIRWEHAKWEVSFAILLVGLEKYISGTFLELGPYLWCPLEEVGSISPQEIHWAVIFDRAYLYLQKHLLFIENGQTEVVFWILLGLVRRFNFCPQEMIGNISQKEIHWVRTFGSSQVFPNIQIDPNIVIVNVGMFQILLGTVPSLHRSSTEQSTRAAQYQDHIWEGQEILGHLAARNLNGTDWESWVQLDSARLAIKSTL